MDADLDTLATALYVTIDDTLRHAPELRPWRPAVGITPKLTDAELLTLAVMQALLGYVSEARWLRHARTHLRGLFPYLPGQSGYNTRLRAAFPLLRYFIRALATDTDLWADPCGSPTPPRSNAAAPSTPCAARPWPAGPPTATAAPTPAGLEAAAAPGHHPARPADRVRAGQPKADERQVLLDLLAVEPELAAARPGLVILADKGYRDAHTEAALAAQRVKLLRPAFKREAPRAGQALFRPLRS